MTGRYALFALLFCPAVLAQPAGWTALGPYSLLHTEGEDLYATRDAALYRSGDLGDTWEQVETDGVPSLDRLAVDENDRLLIRSGDALYRQDTSTSASFALLPTPDAERLLDIEAIGSVLLLTAQTDLGAPVPTGLIYRSEDDGQTWSLATVPDGGSGQVGENELFQTDLGPVQQAPDGALFITVMWDLGYGSALTSSDTGQTWTYLEGYTGGGYLFLLVPLSNNMLLTVGDGLFRSDATRTDWTELIGEDLPFPRSAAETSGVIMSVSGTEVAYSLNWGDTWEEIEAVSTDFSSQVWATAGHFLVQDAAGELYRVPAWRYTSTEPRAERPASLSVVPNPTPARTTLSFSLASVGAARLTLYDLLGREVAVLHDGPASGETTMQTPDLPAGVYVAVLRTARAVQTERFTVVR